MTYEIPMNKDIAYSQYQLNFNLVFNDHKARNKRNLVMSIICIVFGGFILWAENGLGWLFLGMGVFYAINYFHYHNHYKKEKVTFFKKVDNYINRSLELQKPSIWKFEEDSFQYLDALTEIKYSWELFTGHRVIDKNLFLDLEYGGGESLILGEIEIGPENFEKVVAFVTNKTAKSNLNETN